MRLKAAFGEDVHLAAAYGDTAGDREMLAIAEVRGYRVFRAARFPPKWIRFGDEEARQQRTVGALPGS